MVKHLAHMRGITPWVTGIRYAASHVLSLSAVLLFAVGFMILAPLSAGAGEFTTGGEVFAGLRVYPDDAVFGNRAEWDLGGRVDLMWRQGRTWAVKASPRILWDPADPGRWQWIPFELWGEGRAGAWRLRAGRQIFSWGVADAFNPSDILPTRDLGENFRDADKLGDWAVTLVRAGDAWGLEAVVIPWVEGAQFPSARSPWSLDAAASRLDVPATVTLDDTPYLPDDARELSFAGRLRGSFGDTDLYLVGHTGTARAPVLTFPTVGFFSAQARATYLPLHLLGLEGQTALGDWVFKGSWMWRDQATTDSLINEQIFGPQGIDPQASQGVVGAEYLWFEVLGGLGDLSTSLEYLWDTGARESNLATYRPFESNLALGVRYQFNDTAGSWVEASWLESLKRPERFAAIRGSRRLWRNLRAEVFAEFLRGPDGPPSLFYFFEPNDRVGILTRYAF